LINIKATIILEKVLWVGLFERRDKEGCAVASRPLRIQQLASTKDDNS